jgi:hypothetical protein
MVIWAARGSFFCVRHDGRQTSAGPPDMAAGN